MSTQNYELVTFHFVDGQRLSLNMPPAVRRKAQAHLAGGTGIISFPQGDGKALNLMVNRIKRITFKPANQA